MNMRRRPQEAAPGAARPEVREAIAHAIDKKTIVDRVLRGLGDAGRGRSARRRIPRGSRRSPTTSGSTSTSTRPSRSSTTRATRTPNGDGIREMPGGGQAAQFPLRRALRVADIATDRRVHHRLAQGHRDRHHPEDRTSDGQLTELDRQGRLRPVRLGLDPVRRPRPDDVVLHVRPGQLTTRRTRRTTTTTRALRPEYDKLYKQQKTELDPAKRMQIVHADADALLLAVRRYVPLYYQGDLQAYRNDRSRAGIRQPAETGPVLFTTRRRAIRR